MKDDPHISFRRKPASLDQESLENFAELLRVRVAKRKYFHCRVTDDAEMKMLNARFRRKDYPTDVLSFPLNDDTYIGDIAISIQRARTQAKEFGHSLDQELRILLLHGVLHLIGMDHETDRGEMARAEVRWRKILDLPSSLIDRVSA